MISEISRFQFRLFSSQIVYLDIKNRSKPHKQGKQAHFARPQEEEEGNLISAKQKDSASNISIYIES